MLKIMLTIFTAALMLQAGTPVQAQSAVRIRGTITGFDGSVLSIQSRDGRALQVTLPDNVAVAATRKLTLADIKPGDFVGVTSTHRADGTEVAVEVHVLPPSVPAGTLPWDLQPNSTMTNASVTGKVEASGGHTLTLDFKSGQQKVFVPDSVPIAAGEPGTKAMLKPGEYVFLLAQTGPDGKLSAQRVQVSKDGVKPPQ